jgi:hypothetical protein
VSWVVVWCGEVHEPLLEVNALPALQIGLFDWDE